MDYAEGKIMEGIIEEKLAPLRNQLNWIMKAMIDNNAVPKEEKGTDKDAGHS